MGLLLYGLPILLGFICGFFFTVPVNAALTVVAVAIGGGLLWSTRNAEIGGLIGVIAAFLAGVFLAAMWVTVGLTSGFVASIDMSWLLRQAP